jgi:hypothetical protein
MVSIDLDPQPTFGIDLGYLQALAALNYVARSWNSLLNSLQMFGFPLSLDLFYDSEVSRRFENEEFEAQSFSCIAIVFICIHEPTSLFKFLCPSTL